MKDGFIAYKVTLSSDEKHLIEKFKYSYDRKILSGELLRIIRYHRGLQKRHVNYTDAVPLLYLHFKKGTILRLVLLIIYVSNYYH